jgi:rhamnogalacturonyl hydrolase YesR
MRKAAFDLVCQIMTEFADTTGLRGGVRPRRYLWTDAFAVCNFLELYRQTGDEVWLQRAVRVVDQIHHTLGRQRDDDPRSGWISGLSEAEGNQHPTAGGLRIGKRFERTQAG